MSSSYQYLRMVVETGEEEKSSVGPHLREVVGTEEGEISSVGPQLREVVGTGEVALHTTNIDRHLRRVVGNMSDVYRTEWGLGYLPISPFEQKNEHSHLQA